MCEAKPYFQPSYEEAVEIAADFYDLTQLAVGAPVGVAETTFEWNEHAGCWCCTSCDESFEGHYSDPEAAPLHAFCPGCGAKVVAETSGKPAPLTTSDVKLQAAIDFVAAAYGVAEPTVLADVRAAWEER